MEKDVKFVKRYIKSIIWRYKNRHNLTTLKGDFFPLDKVTVGNMTYGPIHAISFGGSDEGLVIGYYCSIADEVVFFIRRRALYENPLNISVSSESL